MTMQQAQSAFYYLNSHAADKTVLFLNNDDLLFFRMLLSKISECRHWSLFAFVLIPTEYHVVVTANRTCLSRGLQQIHAQYSKYYNEKYQHHGSVFKSHFRFQAFKDEGLVEICEGVFKMLTEGEEHIGYSSLDEFMQYDKQQDSASLLQQISKRPSIAIQKLLMSATDLSDNALEKALRKYRVPLPAASQNIKTELWMIFAQADSEQTAICKAYYDHGYSLAEIGAYLGKHKSSISRRVKKCNL